MEEYLDMGLPAHYRTYYICEVLELKTLCTLSPLPFGRPPYRSLAQEHWRLTWNQNIVAALAPCVDCSLLQGGKQDLLLNLSPIRPTTLNPEP